jgi:dihydrofolate reductase
MSQSNKPISIIVVIAGNYAIGLNNQLLWHLPEDLKRFKKLTTGHTVVMGKRTFDSLPIRPLPNRKNIVISDIPGDNIVGCVMAISIEEAIEKCDPENENFIIGGGSIYNQFLPIANKLYITWVQKEFDADVFFPVIDKNIWKETGREDIPFDKNVGFAYSYAIYERK